MQRHVCHRKPGTKATKGVNWTGKYDVLVCQMVKNKCKQIEIISSAALSEQHHMVVVELGEGTSSISSRQIRH